MSFQTFSESEAPKQEGAERVLGRPTLFNEERVGKILYAVQMGATYRIAAQYAGISYDTLHHWRQRSESDGPGSMYYPFHLMLEQNVAKGAVKSLEMIEAAAPADWRAAAWRLSHNPFTRPDYADKAELPSGPDGEPLLSIGALRAVLAESASQGATEDDDFAVA